MLNLLRIVLVAGFLSCVAQADVYTYQYSGASFDTECSNFIGCVPVSGVGGLTGYATFSQPLAPGQTVDSYSPTLLDWQINEPSGSYFGEIGNFTFLLTAGAGGQITSWNVQDQYSSSSPCIFFCEIDELQSSSSAGDSVLSEIDIYYDSFSTSTPGKWTPEFVLTPEPSVTPFAKSLLLLATIAGIVVMRRQGISAAARHRPKTKQFPVRQCRFDGVRARRWRPVGATGEVSPAAGAPARFAVNSRSPIA